MWSRKTKQGLAVSFLLKTTSVFSLSDGKKLALFMFFIRFLLNSLFVWLFFFFSYLPLLMLVFPFRLCLSSPFSVPSKWNWERLNEQNGIKEGRYIDLFFFTGLEQTDVFAKNIAISMSMLKTKTSTNLQKYVQILVKRIILAFGKHFPLFKYLFLQSLLKWPNMGCLSPISPTVSK